MPGSDALCQRDRPNTRPLKLPLASPVEHLSGGVMSCFSRASVGPTVSLPNKD